VLLAGFDLVDLFDSEEIDGVYRQAIKGVGRQGDHIALAQAGDNIVDPVRLGFIGMDAQDLRGQEGLPQFPVADAIETKTITACRGGQVELSHVPGLGSSR